jgi:hypothetical protein
MQLAIVTVVTVVTSDPVDPKSPKSPKSPLEVVEVVVELLCVEVVAVFLELIISLTVDLPSEIA